MKHSILHTVGVALLCLPVLGCASVADVFKALPAGSQYQSTTFGVKISLRSSDPFVLGSHTAILTTAQPDNAPNLNRFEGTAPWVTVKSTVATGAVGSEIEKAGGPEALRFLIGGDAPPTTGLPAEFPPLLVTPKP